VRVPQLANLLFGVCFGNAAGFVDQGGAEFFQGSRTIHGRHFAALEGISPIF
jgi:hypothetical protein